MTIKQMKSMGMNIFHAQALYLIIWEAKGRSVEEWVEKYSARFREYWESLPEFKDNWFKKFWRNNICDFDPGSIFKGGYVKNIL